MDISIKKLAIPKELSQTKNAENGQTIVHCKVVDAELIRIWKTTFLVQNSGSKAELLYADGISIAPEWSYVMHDNGYAYFTLIFESLHADCSSFYLDEIIPEPNGFYTRSVKKNTSGVYTVELLTKA